MAERKTIEIPEHLVETLRTIGEGHEAAVTKIKEAEALRGEKADAMMDAVGAALASLESVRENMDQDDFARLASLAGYTLADLAWIERAEKAIARCEELDAAEEAERQAAELRSQSEFPLTADGQLDIEQVPEAARAMVQGAWEREQAVVAREQEAERIIAEQKEKEEAAAEEELQAEVSRAMEEFKDLPGDKDVRRSTLEKAKRTDEEIYRNMLELWKQEAAAARAPMEPVGSDGEADPVADMRGQAMRTAEARVEKLLDKDPSLTRGAALVQVFKNDAKLHRQYKGITD